MSTQVEGRNESFRGEGGKRKLREESISVKNEAFKECGGGGGGRKTKLWYV